MGKRDIRHAISYREKNADDKKWYREWADYLVSLYQSWSSNNRRRTIKVNYDLFNNKIDLKEFEYVCKPFGDAIGRLPAKMENRDISSPKLKALIGMEMRRPFVWKVYAVNPEATTRKEQKMFEMLKSWVIGQIMQPIQEEIMQQMQQKAQMIEDEQQMQQLQEQAQKQIDEMTPDEIKRYIQREYQDPAEVLASQLLRYLTEELDIQKRFNEAFKHLIISGEEILYVNTFKDQIKIWTVNPLNFYYKLSNNSNRIEDGEHCVALYYMTPNEIVKYFGDELSKEDIKRIYEMYNDNAPLFLDKYYDDINGGIAVYHCVWKALRKVKFLTYIDENDEIQEIIVDEEYKLNKEAGDIAIEEVIIPEVYETWVIGNEIYVRKQPIEGQFIDTNSLYNSKLPYFGIVMDNENSEPVGLMDRIRPYQYLYNIVMYRLELLIASDKGKKVLMNMAAIPKEAGIDIKKWQYFFEASPFMWFDTSEEGSGYQDANTVARYIDLSLASDINKYIQLAEYIRREAGRAIGVGEHFEGQVEPRTAVSNMKQSIIQSSYITESYFNAHDSVKKNVLTYLLNVAKQVYAYSNREKLQYVLDDLSYEMLNIDEFLLENNYFGIYVSNSSRLFEQQELIRQLAHAALQNQLISFSDLIKLLKQDNIAEAEEIIKKGEIEAQKRAMEMQMMQQQMKLQELEMKRKMEAEKHQYKLEEIRVENKEIRDTEMMKMSLVGYSFNPGLDVNMNGKNDFLELFTTLYEKEEDFEKVKGKLLELINLRNRMNAMNTINNNRQNKSVEENNE